MERMRGWHLSCIPGDVRLDHIEPMLAHDPLALRPQQEGQELRRPGRIGRVVQHRRGIMRAQRHVGGQGDRRDLQIGGFGRIEEAHIDLAGLQPPDQVLLRQHLRRILRIAQHLLRQPGLSRHLFGMGQQRHGQLALGVELRIGAADPDAGLLQHLVPGLGLQVGGESAGRVVADHQRRLREGDVPAHPIPVRRPGQHVVHVGAGADEHVALAQLALDLAGHLVRAAGIALEAPMIGLGESRADAVLHQIHQRSRVQHVYRAGCRALGESRIGQQHGGGGRSQNIPSKHPTLLHSLC